jgi:hypothetical protein
MTRVTWTPKTNSQRSALARFGTDWEISSTLCWERPSIVLRGELCWFIQPTGNRNEGRWVPVKQIKIKEGVA